MTAVLEPALTGSRAPRVVTPTAGDDLGWGAEAVELLGLAGFAADGWQTDVLTDQMRRKDGRWAARDCGLVVPRQNGKGVVMLARILHSLFMAPAGSMCVYSSHTFLSAYEQWRLVAEAVQRPALRRRVRRITGAHGSEGVETHDGNRVRIMARSRNSFRGWSIDLLLLDEAMILDDERWSSVLPTISARPDPQVVLASSAGTVESTVLNRLRARALSPSPSGLCWREWSAPEDCRSDDPQALAIANPVLGGRLRPEACESERGSMSDPAFRRERLGIWSFSPVDPADLALDPQLVDRAVDLSVTVPPAGARVHLAFDSSPGSSRPDGVGAYSAVAAAWQDLDDPRRVLATLVRSGPGQAWLTSALDDLKARWSPNRPVGYNSAPGVRDVAADLERGGVGVDGLNTAGYVDACADLARRLQEGTLRLGPSEVLTEASQTALRRKLGEGWAFDRSGPVGVSPLVALAVACWAARSEIPVGEVFIL